MNEDYLIRCSQGLSEEEVKVFRTRVEDLLRRGKAGEKITLTEIEGAIPACAIDADSFDQIVKVFRDQGITVIADGRSMVQMLENLLSDKAVEWITYSALTERAFWIGASETFDALKPDDETSDGLFAKKLLKTLHNRSGDDTFRTTKLSTLLLDLRLEISNSAIGSEKWDSLQIAIRTELDALNREWHRQLDEAQEILSILDTAHKDTIAATDRSPKLVDNYNHQIAALLEALEKALRFHSLIETDHNITSRF